MTDLGRADELDKSIGKPHFEEKNKLKFNNAIQFQIPFCTILNVYRSPSGKKHVEN